MTSAPRPARPATRRDIDALPENVVGEILGGELHVSPRPASRHSVAETSLVMALSRFQGPPNDGRGGWWILVEPELELGDDIIVPDIAGWRRERMPEIPDVAAFTLVPDWVCEVLSPSTTRIDRLKKLPIYYRAGVAHVWLVDPVAMVVEVLRRGEHNWEQVVTVGDERARLVPFDAVEFELAQLWDRGQPPPAR